jgi:hypothetical protein
MPENIKSNMSVPQRHVLGSLDSGRSDLKKIKFHRKRIGINIEKGRVQSIH